MNWRGRPLTSHEIIVDLIGTTTTTTGLTVHCVLDTGQYPTGITYTAKDVDTLPITRHEFHGEWNYHRRADTPEDDLDYFVAHPYADREGVDY